MREIAHRPIADKPGNPRRNDVRNNSGAASTPMAWRMELDVCKRQTATPDLVNPRPDFGARICRMCIFVWERYGRPADGPEFGPNSDRRSQVTRPAGLPSQSSIGSLPLPFICFHMSRSVSS